jgi:hypothetical protein
VGCTTIFLDDSVVKVSHQSCNHVYVPEFVVVREDRDRWDERADGRRDNALWQVAGYLDELRYPGHVARFIKRNPFRMRNGWNGTCFRMVSMIYSSKNQFSLPSSAVVR